MQYRNFAVSLAPSSSNDTLIYAVNASAAYAEVKTVQVANTAGVDYEIDVKWVDDSEKTVSATVYHGDGQWVNYYRYDYSTSSTHSIIQNGYIPAGAVLAVLDAPMFLSPKDIIAANIQPGQPNAASKLMTTVIVTECYDDGLDLTTVEEPIYWRLNERFWGAEY